MFDITAYSIVSVVFLTSFCMFLFIVATNRNNIISRIPMWILLLMLSVMCLRMLFPVEFISISKSVNSFVVMPSIDRVTSGGILNICVISSIIKIIWILGACAFLARYITCYILFKKEFRFIPYSKAKRINSILEDIKTRYKFNFDVSIMSNDVISSPAEFGFIKKVIIIDADRYNDKELYYILLHEMIHFYNHTNWIRLFINLLKCIFWWNPVIYMLDKYVDNLLEIYVDRFISRKCDSDIEYMECIYTVLKKSDNTGYNSKFVKSMAVSAEGRFILRRIKLIAISYKASKALCALLLALTVLFLGISCRYVVQPAYDAPSEELEMPEFNNENSYVIKEDGLYKLYYNDELLLKADNLDMMPEVRIIEK